MSKKFVILTPTNDIEFDYLDSQSCLPPDERDSVDVIDYYQDGDADFIPFINKLAKFIDMKQLNTEDFKNLLDIYRKS